MMRKHYKAELERRALKYYDPETGETSDVSSNEDAFCSMQVEARWIGNPSGLVSYSIETTLRPVKTFEFFDEEFAEDKLRDALSKTAIFKDEALHKKYGCKSIVRGIANGFHMGKDSGKIASVGMSKVFRFDFMDGMTDDQKEVKLNYFSDDLFEATCGEFRLIDGKSTEAQFKNPSMGDNWCSPTTIWQFPQR